MGPEKPYTATDRMRWCIHLSVPLDVLMRRKMIIELEAFILKCSSSVSTDIQTLGSVISRHGLHTKYRARRRFHDM